MYKITNLLNRPRIFSLPKNESLRFLAYEIKEVKANLLTDEIKRNELNGLLRLEEIEKPEPKKKVKKEVPKKEQEEK